MLAGARGTFDPENPCDMGQWVLDRVREEKEAEAVQQRAGEHAPEAVACQQAGGRIKPDHNSGAALASKPPVSAARSAEAVDAPEASEGTDAAHGDVIAVRQQHAQAVEHPGLGPETSQEAQQHAHRVSGGQDHDRDKAGHVVAVRDVQHADADVAHAPGEAAALSFAAAEASQPAAALTAAGSTEAGRMPGADEPVTAMPALSTVDISVLDQLPAAMRLELTKAYGLHSMGATPRKKGGGRRNAIASSSASKRRATAAPSKPPVPRAGSKPLLGMTPAKADAAPSVASSSRKAAPEQGVHSKQSVYDAPLDRPFATRHAGTRTPRCGVHGMTLSQLDPATLSELPEDVQQDVLDSLPRSREAFVQRTAAEQRSAGAPRGSSLVHGQQVCALARSCGLECSHHQR
jgi:hypothetical protein